MKERDKNIGRREISRWRDWREGYILSRGWEKRKKASWFHRKLKDHCSQAFGFTDSQPALIGLMIVLQYITAPYSAVVGFLMSVLRWESSIKHFDIPSLCTKLCFLIIQPHYYLIVINSSPLLLLWSYFSNKPLSTLVLADALSSKPMLSPQTLERQKISSKCR